MRIIAGRYKGRKLLPVGGRAIRPTAEKVREAVFNILAARVQGARFLDLFAGTGALGVEALSRGAAMVVFVEKARPALALIKKNLELLGEGGRSLVIAWDVSKNLSCLARKNFDLVYCDPPYGRGLVQESLETMAGTEGLLSPGALVICEHSPREDIQAPPPFVFDHERRYGKTLVSFFSFVV